MSGNLVKRDNAGGKLVIFAEDDAHLKEFEEKHDVTDDNAEYP